MTYSAACNASAQYLLKAFNSSRETSLGSDSCNVPRLRGLNGSGSTCHIQNWNQHLVIGKSGPGNQTNCVHNSPKCHPTWVLVPLFLWYQKYPRRAFVKAHVQHRFLSIPRLQRWLFRRHEFQEAAGEGPVPQMRRQGQVAQLLHRGKDGFLDPENLANGKTKTLGKVLGEGGCFGGTVFGVGFWAFWETFWARFRLKGIG